MALAMEVHELDNELRCLNDRPQGQVVTQQRGCVT